MTLSELKNTVCVSCDVVCVGISLPLYMKLTHNTNTTSCQRRNLQTREGRE